jgi:hypothetical protein
MGLFLLIVYIFDGGEKVCSLLSYFVIVFLACPFQCRLTDFVSSSSKLLGRLLLQDFSSSCPNVVITFLFGNYSVRVICGQ